MVVLEIQTAVPEDTLFGRWVHTSGYAVPLVVLSFASAWGFPVIAGIVAGDIFAGEDRHGTWTTLLTHSASRRAVFAGKAATACAFVVALILLLAVASFAAGLAATGAQPLVGLSGQMLSGGRSAALTCACWAFALLPGLAFACLALLISVVTQSSAAGMLGPLVVALVMQLLSLVGSGSILRAVLLSDALDAWHGLFVEPAFFGPLAWAALASIVYILACLSIAWVFLRRRDFAGPAPAPAGRGRPARRLALVVAVFAVLAAASSLGSTGVTAGRLEGSIGATFSNLTVLQQEYLGHHIPAGAMLPVLPTCRRQGVVEQNRGPGDDWLCTLDVVTPTAAQVAVNYDVAVEADGCYSADGPPAFIGPLTIRDSHGRPRINPLFRFDGCFEVEP